MSQEIKTNPDPWALFIDDERFPVSDGQKWRIARNTTQALFLIEQFGMPCHIAFDHDLSDVELTGYNFAHSLVQMDLDEEISIPKDFSFYVHSQNPIGRENIEALLNNYIAFKYR